MAKGDKKYSKTYTNPKTGRKNTVRYGAKGYRVKPGTKAGNSYCARSHGINQKLRRKGKTAQANNPNTPNNLSRRKWKCRGTKSMK